MDPANVDDDEAFEKQSIHVHVNFFEHMRELLPTGR